MYLGTVKTITRYWGIKDPETGAYPLHCCAAAGAECEAKGEPWEPMAAVKAYSQIRKRDSAEVLLAMGELCRRHRLPAPFDAIRFLAGAAARLEADAAGFAWGDQV